MTKIVRALVLAALCAVGGLAYAADVSGRWTASFATEVGTQDYTYELHVDGATLTGTAKSNLVGEVTLSDGKVEGDKISFVETTTYQGMPITFNYTGDVVGDEIRFKRELVGFEPEQFVAKRDPSRYENVPAVDVNAQRETSSTVVCRDELSVGSHFKRKRCSTNAQRDAIRRNAQEALRSNGREGSVLVER